MNLRSKIVSYSHLKHWVYLCLWVLLALIFEFHKIISKPPLSIHQGAQVDRASIARNYAKISMNFFEPRVMETATKDGITPCEFPIINYSVALLYKAFGQNTFWYRFLMWCLMGLGLWAVFDMLCLWLGNWISAILVAFTWYFSAILAFYTPNFLPDTASLSLMLLALRQWFFYINHREKFKLYGFALFITLSCLIKISALIFVIAMLLIEAINFITESKKPRLIGSIGFAFAMVFGWYEYCHWLEREVGGSYFLLNFVAPQSILELKDWIHIFYANWFTQIYSKPQWILILIGFCTIPWLSEKRAIKYFVVLTLMGAGCLYLLMAGQFRYHDYYSITLLPVFLFLIIFAFKWLYTIRPWLAYFIVLGICLYGLVEAKNNFRLRYTKGSYYYQTFFEPSDFKGVDAWLRKNNVLENDKILAAFDPNPNTLLYFLNRRGCRTYDHNQDYVNGKLNLYPNLILNDSTRFFKQYPGSRPVLKHKSTFNSWMLFSLK